MAEQSQRLECFVCIEAPLNYDTAICSFLTFSLIISSLIDFSSNNLLEFLRCNVVLILTRKREG